MPSNGNGGRAFLILRGGKEGSGCRALRRRRRDFKQGGKQQADGKSNRNQVDDRRIAAESQCCQNGGGNGAAEGKALFLFTDEQGADDKHIPA